MIAILARFLLIPAFYFAAKYADQGWMIFLTSFLGLTNGYLTVCVLTVAPRGYKVSSYHITLNDIQSKSIQDRFCAENLNCFLNITKCFQVLKPNALRQYRNNSTYYTAKSTFKNTLILQFFILFFFYSFCRGLSRMLWEICWCCFCWAAFLPELLSIGSGLLVQIPASDDEKLHRLDRKKQGFFFTFLFFYFWNYGRRGRKTRGNSKRERLSLTWRIVRKKFPSRMLISSAIDLYESLYRLDLSHFLATECNRH